jgi:hypothetical protein
VSTVVGRPKSRLFAGEGACGPRFYFERYFEN